MTSSFHDKFARADGEIGSDYTVPCGGVILRDETVLPIDDDIVSSGISALTTFQGKTEQKTQVVYTAETLDGPDYIVAGIWVHDEELIGELPLDVLLAIAVNDPSFTVVARMSKDPMLEALGVEDPYCYNQGYGARVTCPRDGSAPVLKIVKYTPRHLPPGYLPPSSSEVDLAQVLASVTLAATDLNIDPAWSGSGNFPYRGFTQEVRFRIRRADYHVVLEVFMNDRSMNTPILSYVDQRDPLWGDVGVPGFEFISPARRTQPAGASPFELKAFSVMRCALFECATVKDFTRPTRVTPENHFTYDRVVDRVIQLVERDGDARYTSSGAGSTKRLVYLDFVVEAERDICRKEGYWHWLNRQGRIYLKDSIDIYELPEDLAEIELIRPVQWAAPPLQEMSTSDFQSTFTGTAGAGQPFAYKRVEESVNNRPQIQLFPIPKIETPFAFGVEPTYLALDYYSRPIYPNESDVQIPAIPQHHMDALIYGAASHALMMDTDDPNAARFSMVYQQKLADLRRENNRKTSTRQLTMRSGAHWVTQRIPMTRTQQLGGFPIIP